jgi:hypothetical protein
MNGIYLVSSLICVKESVMIPQMIFEFCEFPRCLLDAVFVSFATDTQIHIHHIRYTPVISVILLIIPCLYVSHLILHLRILRSYRDT